MPAYNILLLGASYGSLLASKLLFGGHSIHLVCLPAEADLINAEGFKVTLPVRNRKDPVLLESRKLPGKVTAAQSLGLPRPKRIPGNPRTPLRCSQSQINPSTSSGGFCDSLW